MSKSVNVYAERPGWITHRMAQELTNGDIQNIRLLSGKVGKIDLRLRNLFNFRSAEIINYFLPYFLFNNTAGIKISLLTHFEENDAFKKNKWHEAVNNSDFLIAISKFTYNQAIDSGVSKDRIKIIYYGFSEFYAPTFNILLVGSASKRKGLDFFREVQHELKGNQNVKFKSALDSAWGIENFNCDPKNLRSAYEWADAILVTSSLEGAHTGTLEALTMGLDVVTTPVGWAANEFHNLCRIAETPKKAVDEILRLSESKLKSYNENLNMFRNFSYDKWRLEHKLIFDNFSK